MDRVPIVAEYREDNVDYMETKRTRMGHVLDPLESKNDVADGESD